jgi:hypothetical protein
VSKNQNFNFWFFSLQCISMVKSKNFSLWWSIYLKISKFYIFDIFHYFYGIWDYSFSHDAIFGIFYLNQVRFTIVKAFKFHWIFSTPFRRKTVHIRLCHLVIMHGTKWHRKMMENFKNIQFWYFEKRHQSHVFSVPRRHVRFVASVAPSRRAKRGLVVD